MFHKVPGRDTVMEADVDRAAGNPDQERNHIFLFCAQLARHSHLAFAAGFELPRCGMRKTRRCRFRGFDISAREDMMLSEKCGDDYKS